MNSLSSLPNQEVALNPRTVPNVYVVGGDMLVTSMFTDKGWNITSLEDANLVVFTGGSDVDPSLYGEENFASSTNLARDLREKEIYKYSLELGKCMVGICRGGQFLNVMNGGKMIQHVEAHATGQDHYLEDKVTGEHHSVTSTHHQMMIPNDEVAEIVAIANLKGSKFFLIAGKVTEIEQPDDTEVVYYDETASLCFQPHPEYGNEDCREYFFDLLERKFNF